MKPIRTLLNPQMIEDLASRSNLRYGKEIAKEGEFQYLKENTFNLIAKVKHRNGETRTVELMSTTKGFRWKCSCSNKKDLFCEHCVALSLKHSTVEENEE